jgi:AcrR family transcriptional regulator
MPPIRSAENRRKQNRADARRRILDASEALLLEAGQVGFSIRQLVGRCGYSAPTIYHYFGDKTGLIDALLEERLLSTLVTALRAVPTQADPLEEARSRYRAFARWGIGHPDQYRLLMEPRAEDATPLPSGEVALSLMQSPFERLADAGRLPAADLEAISQATWACLHGLITLPGLRPDVDWQPRLIERSLDAVIRGWLIDSDQSSQTTPAPAAPNSPPRSARTTRTA